MSQRIGIFFPSLFFLFFILPPLSFAQQSNLEPTISPVFTTVDYALPYPGILPDNPLYFLKAARDKVISFLIADPLKRGKFDLLQADKRLQMGVYLIQKDKKELPLAVSTISKGQNYFTEAADQVAIIKQKKESSADFVKELQTAAAKHEEVLKDLEKGLSAEEKAEFIPLDKHLQTLKLEIGEFNPQK